MKQIWRRIVESLNNAWKAQWSTGLHPECECHVHFDAEAITVTYPDRPPSALRWSDLEEVSIQTTSDGPWSPDVFWVLTGDGSGLVFPGGATGEKEALARLGQLPGFDFKAVIEAMGCCVDHRFLCWRRAHQR